MERIPKRSLNCQIYKAFRGKKGKRCKKRITMLKQNERKART